MSLWEVLQEFGLPLGMVIVALILGSRRQWVWGAELDAAEARQEKMRLDYEQRLADQRAAHLRREEELAAATARWEQLFFALLGPVSGLADVVGRAQQKEKP